MNIKKYYKTYRVLPDYFYIENVENKENTLTIYKNSPAYSPTVSIEYSFDQFDWHVLGTTASKTKTDPLTINFSNKIYLRGVNNAYGAGPDNAYTVFNVLNNINIGGNIMSLLYGQDYEDKKVLNASHTLKYIFSGFGSKLINSNKLKLPAIQLLSSCYTGMFSGCSAMITGPIELPATELKNYCYSNMFYGCSSLTKAPILWGSELKTDNTTYMCYREMFLGCSNLNYIKTMFNKSDAQSWSDYCQHWVAGVPAGGTFVKNKNATWTNGFGESAIPTGWNVVTE